MENKKSIAKTRIIGYWILTGLLAFELALGALWDFNLVNSGYVADVMKHLGYPAYMGIVLGIWKLPGAATVLIPRYPLLKEWAYAGAFFTFSGAAMSHALTGDGAVAIIAPIVFCCITMGSWALRPESRKL